MMKEYGSKIAPLNVIGTFLNLAGNHMLNYLVNDVLKKERKRSASLGSSRVILDTDQKPQ